MTVVLPAETPLGGKGSRREGAVELVEARREHMQGVLDQALDHIASDIQATGKVVMDHRDALADQEGVDLMVVGSRGYGPLRRVLLGKLDADGPAEGVEAGDTGGVRRSACISLPR